MLTGAGPWNRSMPSPVAIPVQLTRGPFTFQEARAAGLSEKVLRGKRFRRLFPRVWVLSSYEMHDRDWICAAELALPRHAQASHLTRLRKLGLNMGSLFPLHFTVQGELHLDLERIELHRTRVMLPTDDQGVTPAGAFVQIAANGRVIDLIKVGDWLLHHGHMSMGDLLATASRDPWRPGAAATTKIINRLDRRSHSLEESETRALVEFAGLPLPESNVDVLVGGRFIACVDLLFRAWLLVLEYEGRQHAEDPIQFNRDIARYADLRDGRLEYSWNGATTVRHRSSAACGDRCSPASALKRPTAVI